MGRLFGWYLGKEIPGVNQNKSEIGKQQSQYHIRTKGNITSYIGLRMDNSCDRLQTAMRKTRRNHIITFYIMTKENKQTAGSNATSIKYKLLQFIM